jgi:uncharacterized protein (TIGR02391 family)
MAEQRLRQIIPSAEDALALEPEELAGAVIQWLNSAGLQMFNLNAVLRHVCADYEPRWEERMVLASREACSWLEREGLLVPYPGHPGDYFISRRGKTLSDSAKLAAFQLANLLHRSIVHPVILQKVLAAFLRGDYDTAIFQSLREVEIRVRDAGGFPPAAIGVQLMRQAFDVGKGPLIDKNIIAAEQQGESDLFAGAFGTYRNAIGHRTVTIKADEAVELILLASRLMKIVDSRVPPQTPAET